MTPIGRYPAGLLELLGSKSNGVLPTEFDARGQFSLDIAQMLGGLPETLVASGATVEGAVQSLTVPADQWYVLYAASVSFDLTTTLTELVTSLRIFRTNAASVILGRERWASGPYAAGRSDVPMVTWTSPFPMLLPPGEALSARADLIGVDANVTLTLRARVARLP